MDRDEMGAVTEGSRYGPHSLQSHWTLTQTLPVPTQPPTQLMSYEMHQYTQLVHHDLPEHVQGDTLVNDSDGEGPADTFVLSYEDEDRQELGVSAWGSHCRGLSIGSVGQEFHPATPFREFAESDATAVEEDVENAGHDDDADAESQQLLQAEAYPDERGIIIVDDSNAPTRSTLPEVEECRTNFALTDTRANGSKDSQQNLRSISSIRGSSFGPTGFHAACRTTSQNSVQKMGHEDDSESTVDLAHGILDNESKKSQPGFQAELNAVQSCQMTAAAEFDVTKLSPKLTVPFDDKSLACISMSRSVSKEILPIDNAPSEPVIKSHVDSDVILPAERQNSASHYAESTSSHAGPISVGLKRFQSQGFTLSPIGGRNDARFGADFEVQTRLSNSQMARKLVFDFTETQPTDRITSEGSTAFKQISSKQTIGNQTPTKQGSVPGAAANNLHYLESHDPGKESQMNALDFVDKLVSLDASCTPDIIVTSPKPQDGVHTGANCLQSLAQAAQTQPVNNKLDVFEWEDTQIDEDSAPNTKPFPANVGACKRQGEALRLTMPTKKQAISNQQKAPAISCGSQRSDQNISLERRTSQKADVENLFRTGIQDAEIKPHTILTSRLMHSTKTGSMLESKDSRSPGLHKGHREHGLVRQKNKLNKCLETKQLTVEDNIRSKVQKLASQSRRRVGRKKSIDQSGGDLKMDPIDQSGGDLKKMDAKNENAEGENNPEIQLCKGLKTTRKTDKASKEGRQQPGKICKHGSKLQSAPFPAECTHEDYSAADIWIEAFSNHKSKRPSEKNIDLIRFKSHSALHDDSQRDFKKLRTADFSPVIRDNRHLHISEQAETLAEDNGVVSGCESQKLSKKSTVDTAANSARCIGKIEKTGMSKLLKPSLDVASLSGKEPVDKEDVVFQASKKLKVSESHQLKTSHGEHLDVSRKEWKVPEKDKTYKEFVPEHIAKPNETVDVMKGFRKVGSATTELAKSVTRAKLDRQIKTMSRGQDLKRSNVRLQKAASQKCEALSLGKPIEADCKERSNTESSKLQTKEISMPVEHQATALHIEDDPFKEQFFREGMGKEALDVIVSKSMKAGKKISATDLKWSKGGKYAGHAMLCEPAKAGDELSAKGLKRSARGKQAANASAPGLQKGMVGATLQTSVKTDKHVQRTVLAKSLNNDISGSLRKTKSANKPCFGRQDLVEPTKDSNSAEHYIREDGTLKDENVKTSMSSDPMLLEQNKSMKTLRELGKLNISTALEEGRRRKRESSDISVFFSHSLTADAIRHQKKILAKLGGRLAMSGLECTHFISNGFVRSQNMLVSMAAGKIIATTSWLESCGQAHYFVDEKNYILNDEKKEKELGFSMVTSLTAARRKPLFKDISVIICPNTVPEPTTLKMIVERAGGQVLDVGTCFPQAEIELYKQPIVIANENGIDYCREFLARGLKVYSEELVLQGVVTQFLDFIRNRLFENFR